MTSKRRNNRSFDGALVVSSKRNRVQRESSRRTHKDNRREVRK